MTWSSVTPRGYMFRFPKEQFFQLQVFLQDISFWNSGMNLPGFERQSMFWYIQRLFTCIVFLVSSLIRLSSFHIKKNNRPLLILLRSAQNSTAWRDRVQYILVWISLEGLISRESFKHTSICSKISTSKSVGVLKNADLEALVSDFMQVNREKTNSFELLLGLFRCLK